MAAVEADPALVGPLLGQAEEALIDGDTAVAERWIAAARRHAPAGSDPHEAVLLLASRCSLAAGAVLDALDALRPVLAGDGPRRTEAGRLAALAHALRSGSEHVACEQPSTIAEGLRGADDRIARALASGLAGDAAAGLQILADGDVGPDPSLGVGARAPLLRARAGVAEALLHVWAGRIGVARTVLAQAADGAPVSLVFSGLAVALARRLELAVDGATGPLSADLACVVTWSAIQDGFVDRAVAAYLKGRSAEAAVHMKLWAELSAPEAAFALPGLDEAGPFVERAGAVEPREMTAARGLRERIRAAPAASWQTELAEIAEASAAIRSPFERARVEALLGAALATRGDVTAAVRHLRAAHSLFEEAGARAWRDMVARRLARLAESQGGAAATASPPSALEVCRAAWEPILTPRELEVALRMAQGRMNRDIAGELHISVRTVEVHAGRIFTKLDVRSRTELTVLAHRVDHNL